MGDKDFTSLYHVSGGEEVTMQFPVDITVTAFVEKLRLFGLAIGYSRDQLNEHFKFEDT